MFLLFIMKNFFNFFLLKPVRFLLLFLIIPFGAFAQDISVSGTVTDNNGEALIGVSVVQQGTTNGITTDFDGRYTLTVPNNAVLEFSYMGYVTQSVPVQGRSQVNVVMSEDAKLLDEVVVIGYGTQRREAVTGSVASMQGNTLREVQTGNLTSALAGRIAGVQMSGTSSKPGDDMQIRIRGTRSFSGSNDPLVVLDGIPFQGTIGDISPEDIKSIDILKDASATAIYGSRGANGVIMVTTNKGTAGQKAKVTYDGYYGTQTLYHRYPMMTGDQLYQLRKDASVYIDSNGNPTMGTDEVQGMNTDWQDLMFGTGMSTNHSLTISGGTEGGSYSFGGGYYTNEAVLAGQNYTRINLRANIDQAVGKYLRFGIMSNQNYNITNGANVGGMYQALATSPLINPYNDDGSLKLNVSSVGDQNIYTYTHDRISNLGDSWVDNRNAFGSYNTVFGEVKIPGVEGLSYRMNLGLNFRNSQRGRYTGVGVFNDTRDAASSGSMDKSVYYQWTVENIVTYDCTFDKHHINFTGLYSGEKTHTDGSYINATNIPADFFQYWNLARADNVTFDPSRQTFEESALQSWMGRVMYDYDSRYMLSVSYRGDGSSRLAVGHKWTYYPAVSAGWNISREAFMDNVDWINNLKLRAGYGMTANQALSPYGTLGSLSTSQQQYNFGSINTIGAHISEAANPNLGWEKTSTWNIGLDFSLLKNRLWGMAEYYIANTKDILYQIPLPQSSGVGLQWGNVGEMQNKGFELSLNGAIFDNKDGWSWDVGVNFYTNKNKVVEIASGVTQNPSMGLFIGYPINSIFDHQKIGIWQQNDPYLSILEPGGNVGMIKVLYTGDYNDNGVPTRQIGSDDRVITNPDSDWQGGFNTRVAYKGWDLNAIGTYQHGGILVSSLYASNGYLNMLSGRRGNVDVDYWTPTNTNAKYPFPGGIGGDNPKYGSTLGYFDASYFRLGQITLGYNFDPKANWFKYLGLGTARLYFSVQNVCVLFSNFTKESGMDILTNSRGNENAAVTTSLPYSNSTLTIGTNTPQTRNYLFGLNLSF